VFKPSNKLGYTFHWQNVRYLTCKRLDQTDLRTLGYFIGRSYWSRNFLHSRQRSPVAVAQGSSPASQLREAPRCSALRCEPGWGDTGSPFGSSTSGSLSASWPWMALAEFSVPSWKELIEFPGNPEFVTSAKGWTCLSSIVFFGVEFPPDVWPHWKLNTDPQLFQWSSQEVSDSRVGAGNAREVPSRWLDLLGIGRWASQLAGLSNGQAGRTMFLCSILGISDAMIYVMYVFCLDGLNRCTHKCVSHFLGVNYQHLTTRSAHRMALSILAERNW
jgi:hypothetical protein